MYDEPGVGKHPRQRGDHKVETGLPRLTRAILEPDAADAALSLELHPWPPDAPGAVPIFLWRIETYTGVKMTQIGFLELGILVDGAKQPVALPEVDGRDGWLRPPRSEGTDVAAAFSRSAVGEAPLQLRHRV